ncbi:tyrosyl-DNA phosphodiesterase 1 isoform X1 [Mercurialis annua]|uniref:tyrosyl-DNA phosphodiesterase 1 isoform X1 n=1 Tax=Mercurialis annua TaxID=3986 RepID=UPI0021603B2E|nr:tyrosyl-DNA phosphodiesterase 1 isoform X1 [Mercurialis annua]
MSHTQISYLIPLKLNLEEDTSIPKIPLAAGSTTIGRTHVSVPDKRLSRNHLSLTATADGSAFLTPEGSNPVVVKSGDERKKVRAGEKVPIISGDVIELIPGHHFFKFVSKFNSPNKRQFHNDASKPSGSRKKNKVEEECDGLRDTEEAIRKFNVDDDKLSQTFRLLKVKELPAWANTSCVSITDVIQGDILVAVLSNYMVDIPWLISACPILTKVPHVLVLHGEGDGSLELLKRSKPANWILHKPPLPISFGTHHSKAMFLIYPRGVRIIIHTANLIFVDWNNKSQGLWMQDFPWKDEKSQAKGCAFENDLIDYLNALKWPGFTVKLPELGNVTINPSFFKKFDYGNATVRLIASVPGYHSGANLKKWGHMKLRTILEECIFAKEFKNSPLAFQFSSLGSLDAKWLSELATSLSSGLTQDKTPLGLGEPRIIWPTVENVRCSLEGYAAGNAIPSPSKNVEKDFLKKYWSKWKATHTGRCRAMPHIKTFTRYNGQNLAWLLLTSANLSKAAWGALQKNNSQLMIRSYELGVLFLPSFYKKRGNSFSCTNPRVKSEPTLFEFQDKCGLSEDFEAVKTQLVTLMWRGPVDPSSEVVRLPVPYELPPQPYSSEDVPWSWDRQYSKKDVYGQVWPRSVQLYTS